MPEIRREFTDPYLLTREQRADRAASTAVHRAASPLALRRALARSQGTNAAKRLCDEQIEQVAPTIEDYRQQVREECFRPMEHFAPRKPMVKGKSPKRFAEVVAASVEIVEEVEPLDPEEIGVVE